MRRQPGPGIVNLHAGAKPDEGNADRIGQHALPREQPGHQPRQDNADQNAQSRQDDAPAKEPRRDVIVGRTVPGARRDKRTRGKRD